MKIVTPFIIIIIIELLYHHTEGYGSQEYFSNKYFKFVHEFSRY